MTCLPMLDRWNRVSVRWLGGRVSSFHLCGTLGIAMATLTGLFVTWLRGLPLRIVAALLFTSVVTFLVLTIATKIILGREELIYYRHEVAVMLTAAQLLRSLEQPLLPFLETTLLGVGAFLACGRVGCFMVGCCHGCPHRCGVRYRREHAAEGFPEALVGVRLLPVQLIESVCVIAIVVTGVYCVGRGAAPGAILAWYSIVYGPLRFALEFFRGDGVRSYYGTFSEAQWTTFVLMSATVAAEWLGVLPSLRWWHLGVTLAVGLLMLVWANTGKVRRRVFLPTHVEEFVGLFRSAKARSRESERLEVGITQLGLRLSSRSIPSSRTAWVDVVELSMTSGKLDLDIAKRLARLLSLVDGRDGQLTVRQPGLYQLVFSGREPDQAA